MRWNVYAQAVAAVGQVVITLLLVRLLEPAEFGRVALVYLVAGLVALLDEGGFSTKLIASDERRKTTLNVIFYQEILVGLAFSAGVVAVAPALALAFDQPDLTLYLLALAPVFVLTGPRRFYQTLFQRDFAFRAMGQVRMAAVVSYIAATLVLAQAGYGVWSLVWGLIVRMILESIGFVVIGLRQFVPRLPNLRTWRTGYGKAGMAKVSERVLTYTVERLDILIIGKALGPDALGVYDVFKRFSIGLYQQVVPMFSRIALPRMAKLQSRPAALARAYVEQLRFICYLLFPAYLFQVFFAEAIVRLLFGEDWLVYSPIFVWISVLLLVRGISGPVDALLMARGWVRRELYYSAVLVTLLAGTLLYFVSDGLEATVVAVTWLYVVLTIPIYLWIVRPASYVGRLQYFRTLATPFVMAGIACFGALGFYIWLGLSGGFGLTVAMLMTVALYAMLLASVDRAVRVRILRK